MAESLFENDGIKDNKARDFFIAIAPLLSFSSYCLGLGII